MCVRVSACVRVLSGGDLKVPPTRMALESEEDKCMYAFGAALATQTDQFKKVLRAKSSLLESKP